MPFFSREKKQDKVEKGEQKKEKPLQDPAYKWGITPSEETHYDSIDIPKDHPVHKIPLEKQEKMRAKGINPVLKAEIDESIRKGGGNFWVKVAGTVMGGGVIR